VHGWNQTIFWNDVKKKIVELDFRNYKKAFCDKWGSLLQGWEKVK